MPGEAPVVVAEAVLEELAHRRLGLGERDEAVADVADGRDPELVAQAARRAAVVGDRDDRGQVGAVLLEAAEQDRQAGAAADRDDPRAAGEESAAVDEVDERLVGAVRERPQQGAQDAVRPVAEEGGAAGDEDGRTHPVRQELERDERDDGLDGVVDDDLAVQLAEGERAGEGERDEPDERDQEPALDADARAEPGPQVHPAHRRSSSRWKTLTGPYERFASHAAISSARTIERW